MAKPKRKPYQPFAAMFGAVLTHMRDVAFGHDSHMEMRRVVDRSERMRDDDALAVPG